MKNPMTVVFVLACLLTASAALGDVQVSDLKCEYRVDPLGIDVVRSRLGWLLTSDQRGKRQTAYQILVAGSPDKLSQDMGDLWDSGRVESDRSNLIAYAGETLASHQRCFWKVRVWDGEGNASTWSKVSTWTMGMVSPEEWRAEWIAMPENRHGPDTNLDGATWIWGLPKGETGMSVPPGPCSLSRTFNLPNDAEVRDACLLVTADNSATVRLNGKPVTKITEWENGRRVCVKDLLVSGANKLSILAENGGSEPNPAGVICKLTVRMAGGQTLEIVSDRQWSVTAGEQSGGTRPATEITPWGQEPWGTQATFSETDSGLPVFRKLFVVDGPLERALVNVSGLGHYELFLNGQKVGERFLAPAWSVYEKTVYYNSYDITDLLSDGENEFRIMLGKGFYNTQGDRRVHGVDNAGVLKAILEARLEYAQGSTQVVVTDDTWDAASGPINHCAILAGSDFDAGAAEPHQWSKAARTGSLGTLRAAESPPMALFERLSPVKPADEPEPGIFVYDFGQNLSALPHISVRGQKGQVVRLTPAEQRHGQTDRHNNGTGRVNQAGVGSPNYYEYTLNGQGVENWQPQFTYGGFQYLEVTGAVPKGHPNPDNLPVLEQVYSVHVRSATKQVGAFSCSNPLFVKIDEAIDRAVRSNLAHVLTDCPTREKLGWLEVAYLMGPSISRRYDLSRLYAKVTRDIRESQGADGVMYTVAPNYPQFSGGFRYTPEWGAAGVIVPWQLYRWYGDKRVLRENLPAMKAFVDHMKTTSNDLVPVAGLGDWYDYGHGKGSGPAKFTPPELTAMATFYRCATTVAKAAEVLGEKEQAHTYKALADEIRNNFNRTFYTGSGLYKNNGSPQTANAMALVTGLCNLQNEQAVLDAVLRDLEQRDYQQTAGDVGFHYLVETLGRYGCHETVDTILNRRDEGSYGFIMDRGWTSLPEAWDANTRASMNHCMLGHIQQWFYRDLLGIRQAEDSVAFREIVIKPAFETNVEWAKGHYDAVCGRISVDWKKTNGQLSLNVEIPVNTTAKVYVPARDAAEVTESGRPVDQAETVTFVRLKEGCAVFEVGSGAYAFDTRVE